MLKKKNVTKEVMTIEVSVCIWIIVANLIVNLLHLPEHGIHFSNWCFFMINIIYFIGGDANMKTRFIQTLGGSIVGILLAGFTTLLLALLWKEQGMGGSMEYVPSLMIPLAICLVLIIVLHPIFPVLFNNYGFVFYLTSLTVMGSMPWGGNAITNIPSYIVSAVLGHIIVNGVSLLIIGTVKKHYAKQTQKTEEH